MDSVISYPPFEQLMGPGQDLKMYSCYFPITSRINKWIKDAIHVEHTVVTTTDIGSDVERPLNDSF